MLIKTRYHVIDYKTRSTILKEFSGPPATFRVIGRIRLRKEHLIKEAYESLFYLFILVLI